MNPGHDELKYNSIYEALRSSVHGYIEFEDEGSNINRVTFNELFDYATGTANHLREILPSGGYVGVSAKNSLYWIALDLACVISGHILVPLAEEQYAEFSRFMKFDLYVTDAEVARPGDGVLHMNLAQVIEKSRPDSRTKTAVKQYRADEVVTVIFTSGTTSLAKAIEFRAECFDDFAVNACKYYGLGGEDKILVILPFSVYTSRIFIYLAVLLDCSILLATSGNLFPILRRCDPTIFVGVPSIFELVANSTISAINKSVSRRFIFQIFVLLRPLFPRRILRQCQIRIFKQMRQIWGKKMRLLATGSAPISKKALEIFDNAGMGVYEGYGTTETGLIAWNYPGTQRIGSVGKPFPSKEVLICDDGQIYVRGKYCWARRYLFAGDHASEQRVFREDGYIATGDTGCFDQDGFLYLKGRVTDIVALPDGSKLHPKDIEEKFNDSLYFSQSAVFQIKGRLCLALVTSDSHTCEKIEHEITRINRSLPPNLRVTRYKVFPASFSIANGMLTTSLKLNRRKIQEAYGNDDNAIPL